MKDHHFKKNLLIVTYCFLLLFIIIRFDSVLMGISNFLSIATPFFIGITIAFVLNQPMMFFDQLYSKWIKKKKLSQSLAITTSYLLFILIIIALFLFIFPQLISNISNFIMNLGGYIKNLETVTIDILQKLQLDHTDISHFLNAIGDLLQKAVQFILGALANAIPQLALFTTSIISTLFTLIIALVVSINLLAGKHALMSQAKRIIHVYLPKKWAIRLQYIGRVTSDIFSKYVIGQLTEACILGVLCAIGMKILGFEYSILISTVIAVTALIPIMGAYIGGAFAFVLLSMISPLKALLFILYFSILQQLENSIIYPRVVGASIGLPGLWVIFAVTIGGGLFGLPGILLSVPVMSVIYTLLKEDVTSKYIPIENETSLDSELPL